MRKSNTELYSIINHKTSQIINLQNQIDNLLEVLELYERVFLLLSKIINISISSTMAKKIVKIRNGRGGIRI